MLRIFALWLVLTAAAIAQVPQTGAGINGASTPPPSYSGPGDVVASAVAWWGLRAYSAAYAASLGKIANICTPLDAVCADVNSDASGNFNLSGTGSLLCNNSTSICTIKTFYDQSGTNSCSSAPCNVTQTTAASRLTLVTGCLGSLVCASGAGSESYETSNFPHITTPMSTSGIAQRTAATTSYQAITGDSSADYGLYFDNAANTMSYFVNSGSPTITANDNAWHACQGVRDTTDGVFAIACDGTTESNNTGNVQTLTNQVFVATDGDGEGIQGMFEEVGWWAVAFNSTQITNMNSNQHSYWGF